MTDATLVSNYPNRLYRISSSPKARMGWLIMLVGLTFALRVIFLDTQSLWRDEVDALNFATVPWPKLLGNFFRPGWNGPLYFLLLRGWVALTGSTAFAMRFFSLVWGVLEVPLVYMLGRRHFSRRAAGWAALLAALSPYLIWYAAEVKMYTWMPLLVLLALYALDRACVRPRWGWWAVVVLGISLAVYSHILAALSIPVVVLWFLLHPRRHHRAWIGMLVSLALLTLPYLPLLVWQWPMVLQDRGVTGFPALTFSEMMLNLLVSWSTGVPGWGRAIGAWVFGALALLGGFALLWRGRWRAAATYGAWILTPLTVIWWLSLRGPLFTDRYLIWVAPAFYVLVGVGLAALPGGWLPRGVLLGLLLLAGVNVGIQMTRPFKPQFREATAHLRRQRLPDALLLFQIPYNRVMVDYYLPLPLEPWAEAPFTNFRDAEGNFVMTPADVAAQLRVLTQGYGEVWLVYSEASMWDERELVKAWLDQQGDLLAETHFVMVSLYHYRLDNASSSP